MTPITVRRVSAADPVAWQSHYEYSMVFHRFRGEAQLKQLAVAMMLTLVLLLTGALATGAEDSVDVDGVWGISEQGTAGEGINCDRWASGPAGAASAISDTNPGIQNEVSGDENQIRYGAQDVNDDPPPCHVFADQSGFGFDGVDGASMPSVGTPFKLGIFTHYNSVTKISCVGCPVFFFECYFSNIL